MSDTRELDNALVDGFLSYSHSQTFRCESHLDTVMSVRHSLPTHRDSAWEVDAEVGPRPTISPSSSYRPPSPDQPPFLDNIDENATNSQTFTRPLIRPVRSSSSSQLLIPTPSYGSFRHDTPITIAPHSNGHSRPPLQPSQPIVVRPSHPSSTIPKESDTIRITESQAKVQSGGSTYGQSLFNSIAVLVGVGILSEPLAFASAGWVFGTLLIIFYGALSCYTAKILGRFILTDASLQTYADIGNKAFGPRANVFTSFLFCLELFFVSCVFVTLAADSLHSMFPEISENTYKLVGLVILFPTMFVPLRLISYASAIGIISTIFLIFVVFYDGFSKPTAPGSLYDPAPTDVAVTDSMKLGAAFGLFMSGFAGHAVIPNLAKDMAEPHRFDHMVNWAFFVATLLYALIGAAGYVMFGREVSDEISLDLLRTPGYNRFLNQIAVWMLIISPLTKYPLTTRALNITLEVMLGIHEPLGEGEALQEVDASPPHVEQDSSAPSATAARHLHPTRLREESIRSVLRFIERFVVASTIVAVSILVPQFSTLMAFLGAFSAFTICIIGPLIAKIVLERKVRFEDACILLIVGCMTIWGTYVSCRNGGAGGL